jgi:hypothetical protein
MKKEPPISKLSFAHVGSASCSSVLGKCLPMRIAVSYGKMLDQRHIAIGTAENVSLYSASH